MLTAPQGMPRGPPKIVPDPAHVLYFAGAGMCRQPCVLPCLTNRARFFPQFIVHALHCRVLKHTNATRDLGGRCVWVCVGVVCGGQNRTRTISWQPVSGEAEKWAGAVQEGNTPVSKWWEAVY